MTTSRGSLQRGCRPESLSTPAVWAAGIPERGGRREGRCVAWRKPLERQNLLVRILDQVEVRLIQAGRTAALGSPRSQP
jgi:hypothetical protein